ncbi:MAG: hypothetical protein HY058_14115 [Proteobacteria bacterium]|nr:hypothetical protein [Pseudomonadota bacterium]
MPDATATQMSVDEIAVKKAAVRILHSVCDNVLGAKNAFTATLTLTLQSANNKTFEYNFRVAEQEFQRLPAEVIELVVGKCNSHIASNQKAILAQIKTLTGAPAPAGKTDKAGKRPTSAVDWF